MVVIILVLGAAIGWGIHHEVTKNRNLLPTKSKLAYVDGGDAVDQVDNFYHQYITNASKPDFQRLLISSYGNQNLVFYSEYYRHGFDPIICSTAVPTAVTASLVSTGPIARVKAVATYPDNTTATIMLRVVLDDKLSIDSMTCPGAKGNLPPAEG